LSNLSFPHRGRRLRPFQSFLYFTYPQLVVERNRKSQVLDGRAIAGHRSKSHAAALQKRKHTRFFHDSRVPVVPRDTPSQFQEYGRTKYVASRFLSPRGLSNLAQTEFLCLPERSILISMARRYTTFVSLGYRKRPTSISGYCANTTLKYHWSRSLGQ